MLSRIHVPVPGLLGDANIHHRHPADPAAWIWHPECAVDQTAVLRFSLDVEHAGGALTIHVSADQRFVLSVDGIEAVSGPDRGDLQHWSVHAYRLDLPAGRHRISALVTWLNSKLAPCAQVTHRGGFLFAVEGADPKAWNTGLAPWMVERLDPAVGFPDHRISGYLAVGPRHAIDLGRWSSPAPAVPAVIVVHGVWDNDYGLQRAGWRLHPSRLHEQVREPVTGGRIRSVGTDPDAQVHDGAGDCAPWQALVEGRGPLTVPANSRVAVLWDLGTYHCGYPDLVISGGRGAEIVCDWAESLFEAASSGSINGGTAKGRRDAVDGKAFVGFGDAWTGDGGRHACPALWWRAGRFIQLTVRTADEPLVIERLAVRATRHPLEAECSFASPDADLAGALPLMVRVLQMCAHETFIDCPYYEQLLYTGDGRLECLTHYAVQRDDALPKRCIELFDWSRWSTGMAAERYPSRDFQVSTTYAMFWPLMVRDHLWWRGDAAFARQCLTGVRSQHEYLMALTGTDGLLGKLPGWSFVDWVPSWCGGVGPGVKEGDSSIVNLQWVLCLQATAELEDAVGEAMLARRCRDLAARVGAALVARWWDEGRGLLADESAHKHFSEHAQSLALIAGVLDPARAKRCLDSWLAETDLAQATVYFSFYPMEALARAGRGDEILRRLAFWKGLKEQGFTTCVEMPEPSRSDCHAWGAHPLWHLQASIAGIRPASPGFATVEVAPNPGGLDHFEATCPHPAGVVRVAWRRSPGAWSAEVELPPGISGTFRFAGTERRLQPGVNRVVPTSG